MGAAVSRLAGENASPNCFRGSDGFETKNVTDNLQMYMHAFRIVQIDNKLRGSNQCTCDLSSVCFFVRYGHAKKKKNNPPSMSCLPVYDTDGILRAL